MMRGNRPAIVARYKVAVFGAARSVAKAKKLKPQDIVSRMGALFELLDEAKLAPATILKTEAQKEHYETLLMFAFRKRQAARYHRDRVDELLKAKQKEQKGILLKVRRRRSHRAS